MEILRVEKRSYTGSFEKNVYGYIDKETVHYQSLYKCVFVFGFLFFKIRYFSETIPNWAFYQYCCTGFTDWKSSNEDVINDCINNKVIFKIEWKQK